VQPFIQLNGTVRTLGQHLESVSGGTVHDFENGLDESSRNGIVKQIGHGVHEHQSWLPPPERVYECRFMDGHRESVCVFRDAHGLQPPRHAFSVTMLASVADLGATGHGVPRVFGPFDG